jgi:SARP family transcriptional regulator, regulator of embCAB operon
MALVVQLLGGFELHDDEGHVGVGPSEERLIAFVALAGQELPRPHVALHLWPPYGSEQAGANLRSTLWRLRRLRPSPVAATRTTLRLASDVTVDTVELTHRCRLAITGNAPGPDVLVDIERLGSDLLPGWHEDWVQLERERFRQLRLHALEALCHQLLAHGRFAEAVAAASTAVGIDPLRESGTRMLVAAHLAEGNPSEALRTFRSHERKLQRELGLRPTRRLLDLVEPLVPAGAAGTAVH